nr:hypothetical protein [Archangium gephyra]
MGLHDLPGEEEPEPEPAVVTLGDRPLELLEDTGLGLARETDALVLDDEPHRVRPGLDPDLQRLSLPELDGVLEQVGDGLLQSKPVPPSDGGARGPHFQRGTAARQLLAQVLHHLLDHLAELHLLPHQLETPRADAGDLEDLLDERAEPHGLGLDAGQLAQERVGANPLLRRVPGQPVKARDAELQGRQGRAKLMGGDHEEDIPEPDGLLGLLIQPGVLIREGGVPCHLLGQLELLPPIAPSMGARAEGEHPEHVSSRHEGHRDGAPGSERDDELRMFLVHTRGPDVLLRHLGVELGLASPKHLSGRTGASLPGRVTLGECVEQGPLRGADMRPREPADPPLHHHVDDAPVREVAHTQLSQAGEGLAVVERLGEDEAGLREERDVAMSLRELVGPRPYLPLQRLVPGDDRPHRHPHAHEQDRQEPPEEGVAIERRLHRVDPSAPDDLLFLFRDLVQSFLDDAIQEGLVLADRHRQLVFVGDSSRHMEVGQVLLGDVEGQGRDMHDHRIDFAGRQAQQSFEIIGNGDELKLGMSPLQVLMGSEVLADRDPQPPHLLEGEHLIRPLAHDDEVGDADVRLGEEKVFQALGGPGQPAGQVHPSRAQVLQQLAEGGGSGPAELDAQLVLQQPGIVLRDAAELSFVVDERQGGIEIGPTHETAGMALEPLPLLGGERIPGGPLEVAAPEQEGHAGQGSQPDEEKPSLYAFPPHLRESPHPRSPERNPGTLGRASWSPLATSIHSPR